MTDIRSMPVLEALIAVNHNALALNDALTAADAAAALEAVSELRLAASQLKALLAGTP